MKFFHRFETCCETKVSVRYNLLRSAVDHGEQLFVPTHVSLNGMFLTNQKSVTFSGVLFFFFSIKSSLRSSSPANTAVNFFTVWTHEDSIITPTPSWDVVKQLGYQSWTKILLKDTCLVRFLNQQNLYFKFMNLPKALITLFIILLLCNIYIKFIVKTFQHVLH